MYRHVSHVLVLSSLLLAAASCTPDASEQTQISLPANEPILITAVEMGDVACYFLLETDESVMASFDLCDPGLVGSQHIPTFGTVEVQSSACEGDPNCTLTTSERLVVDLTPIANDQQ
ncbi:MAG: hypothetical protein AAGI03_12220 [Pseudomonadota bacterium]